MLIRRRRGKGPADDRGRPWDWPGSHMWRAGRSDLLARRGVARRRPNSGIVSQPLVEEVWASPLPLPSIAYISVHPAGKGPFPLVIMNHGVAMDPKERSFFPLVEFRQAAFWFARRGYLVVAPAGPGYGGIGLDLPERGIHGVFFQKIGKCGN